jgi:isoquinoline 1-oxidoreductase beta subunit
MQYSPERMQKVITTCVEKANFGKERSGVYQGFSAYYCHNTHVAEVADVVMEGGAPVVKKITCVIDCGIVVNPLGAKNQVEGGVIDGIGHAMYGELRFDEGAPQSSNFDTYRLIRMNETPEVETYFIENEISPTGLGEPALPPASGAVANAIKAATGFRMTKQPFIQYKEVFERELTGSQ